MIVGSISHDKVHFKFICVIIKSEETSAMEVFMKKVSQYDFRSSYFFEIEYEILMGSVLQ